MITTEVRFSYLNVFEPQPDPQGTLKYSVSMLIDKTDTEGIKELHNAINIAVQKGLDINKYTQAQVKGLRFPIRDGDEEFEAGNRGPEYKGCFFVNASSKNKPGVVKAQANSRPVPIFDPDDFFSGCFGRVDVNFFPYNQAGNRGIGCGLNNIMMIREGERLDGRMKAEDAFANYTDESGVDNVAAADPASGDLE
jgi:hypothetical protein